MPPWLKGALPINDHNFDSCIVFWFGVEGWRFEADSPVLKVHAVAAGVRSRVGPRVGPRVDTGAGAAAEGLAEAEILLGSGV